MPHDGNIEAVQGSCGSKAGVRPVQRARGGCWAFVRIISAGVISSQSIWTII